MTMLLLNATRWSGRTYAEGRALGNGVLYAMNVTFCGSCVVFVGGGSSLSR